MNRQNAVFPILGLILVLVGIVAFGVLRSPPEGIFRSPIGLAGLFYWLDDQNIPVRSRLTNHIVRSDSVGLLVVPVHDTALNAPRPVPQTPMEQIQSETEYDLSRNLLIAKANRVPTMIILPKWRAGMRRLGIAHPDLLVGPKGPASVLSALGLTASISQNTKQFDTFDGPDNLSAQIYLPQTFQASQDKCTPMIGTANAMVLARCTLNTSQISDKTEHQRVQSSVLILSDPDLISNHGLHLGDNALIVSQILRAQLQQLAPEGKDIPPRSVWIDYGTRVGLVSGQNFGAERERTWTDIMQYFRLPFAAVWLGSAVCLGLFMWRSAWRAAPIQKETSKTSLRRGASLMAQARLMRNSGRNGALVADYTRARLTVCATALFGPQRAHSGGDRAVILDFTERNRPKFSNPLRTLLTEIDHLSDTIPAAHAARIIRDLDRLMKDILHDA
ncbi:MAG: hypothetical protein P8Q92_08390 [Pseudoprimorskyibacter sp.]|nr:hypothetical protein [Pseudoprimorskyibacter sp.]